MGAITCSGTPKVCTADVEFTPDANFNGADGFSYTASDGEHDSAPATVAITVDPVNDAPTADAGEPHDRRGHAADAEPGAALVDRRGDRRRRPDV